MRPLVQVWTSAMQTAGKAKAADFSREALYQAFRTSRAQEGRDLFSIGAPTPPTAAAAINALVRPVSIQQLGAPRALSCRIPW